MKLRKIYIITLIVVGITIILTFGMEFFANINKSETCIEIKGEDFCKNFLLHEYIRDTKFDIFFLLSCILLMLTIGNLVSDGINYLKEKYKNRKK